MPLHKLLARAEVAFISLCTFVILPLALVPGAVVLHECVTTAGLIG